MFKQNQIVYCLYVNRTFNYVSFKLERGKFLGEGKDFRIDDKRRCIVEHEDDEVNYLNPNNIYASEKEAMEGLVTMVQTKLHEERKHEEKRT